VRLRIFTEPQQGATYDDLLAVARSAEELGFDGFFRSDHYLHMGDGDPGPGPTDAWVTLAGLARETSRGRLGTLVTAATFRLPGPLAITVAQVDAMSGGRVELGIGAGWYDAEHMSYGIPFPSTAERFGRLEEQLEIITGLWRTPLGESYSFQGAHYSLQNSPALPKPLDPGPRIIIGGFGAKRTPRLAARFANEFNAPFAGVDDARRLIDNVRRACADLGRDDPVYSTAQVVCCGTSDDEIVRRASRIGRDVDELRQNGLAGTPNELVDKIGRFAEIGCARIHLQLLDLEDVEHIELIAQQVMPHV